MSNEIEIRKSDNRLIIGRFPSWIAQWGNVVILAVCLLLLFISFRLTFPVVVQGRAFVSGNGVCVVIPLIKQKSIRQGQETGLRMDDYPYMDYGVLRGKVSSLTDVTQKDNRVYIPIVLSNETNTVKQSDLIPDMQGTGEIIVDRVPLIYRILKTK